MEQSGSKSSDSSPSASVNGSTNAAARNRQIAAINSDVVSLLSVAGQAISALTEKPIVDSQSVHGHDIEAHKREFQTRTTEYFALVKRISDQLQKQAEALEDAGIVTGDSIHTDARAEITNGGLGNLDVGLLNARVDDAGSRKEVELFEEMSALLKEVTEK